MSNHTCVCTCADEISDRLDRERRYHEETKGYRQHAEQALAAAQARIAELETCIAEHEVYHRETAELCDAATRFQFGDYTVLATKPGGPWFVTCPWKGIHPDGVPTLEHAVALAKRLAKKGLL